MSEPRFDVQPWVVWRRHGLSCSDHPPPWPSEPQPLTVLQELKGAGALFVKLNPSDRHGALNSLND
jgi:hypothetical protein